jgi:hypothetical protein
VAKVSFNKVSVVYFCIFNYIMADGLGDTIEWITTKTGIKKLAPKKCGACEKRRQQLNKSVPYKTKKQ